jgi:hypothetical protein
MAALKNYRIGVLLAAGNRYAGARAERAGNATECRP